MQAQFLREQRQLQAANFKKHQTTIKVFPPGCDTASKSTAGCCQTAITAKQTDQKEIKAFCNPTDTGSNE
jgi:hypothetical protein